MLVLVTGANGQLGQAIQSIAKEYNEIDFVLCSSSIRIFSLSSLSVAIDFK